MLQASSDEKVPFAMIAQVYRMRARLKRLLFPSPVFEEIIWFQSLRRTTRKTKGDLEKKYAHFSDIHTLLCEQ